MKSLALISFLAGIFLKPVLCAEDLFFEGDLMTAQKVAKSTRKLVMIDFKAEWCGPCKMLDQTTWRDENVISTLKDKAVAVKVDVDENGELAAKYSIHSLPTVIFVDGNGNEVSRFIGYRDAEGFLKEFSKLEES
jgi:thioredoxin